jgi:hypothetical protein
MAPTRFGDAHRKRRIGKFYRPIFRAVVDQKYLKIGGAV